MKFAALVFDKVGCCDTHIWAEVNHDNGRKSSIYDLGDGTWSVVTHVGGGLLHTGEIVYSSQEAVEARLLIDAGG